MRNLVALECYESYGSASRVIEYSKMWVCVLKTQNIPFLVHLASENDVISHGSSLNPGHLMAECNAAIDGRTPTHDCLHGYVAALAGHWLQVT